MALPTAPILKLIVLALTVCSTMAQAEYDDLTFLGAFGYLDIDVGDGTSQALISVPESTKTKAVKDFQSYYGLPVTGVVDAATIKAMQDPRCGVPDREKGGYKIKRYVTTDKLWTKNILTYRFLNYTTDISKTETRAAFQEAFNHWEGVSGLQFKEVTERHIKADMEIAYIVGEHEDRTPFNSIVLAHAFYPQIGWLHMNDVHRWNYKSSYGTDTVYVATHEIGHILGLKHSIRGSIMHASYPGYSPSLRLSKDDIDGVQRLFGANPCRPNPCQNRATCRKKEGRGYKCYCLSGYSGSRCEKRNNRKENIKRCKRIKVQNAVTYPSGAVLPNTVVRVFCKSGYTLNGAQKLTCSAGGYYSPRPTQTKCIKKIVCPELKIAHGEAYPSYGAVPSTVVSFRCKSGYELSGSTKLKCRSDGTYDRKAPTCVEISFEGKELDVNCPKEFDALVSRTLTDSLIYAAKGGQYWIFKRGSTGAPLSHWKSSAPFENGLNNIPTNLDAAFSFEDSDKRYICWVKWPKVYFMNIITNNIDQILDFSTTFGLKEQITAAIRWDQDTVYFFVPRGYYIYDLNKRRLFPSFKQPMSNFKGMNYRVTATAASKSFYTGIMYLFVDDEMYLIRKRDMQVTPSSPQKISNAWRHGLDTC